MQRASHPCTPSFAAPALVAMFLALTLTACGGSKGGSPTEPGPSAAAGLAAPAGFNISELSVKDRTVTFTWNAAPGATGYVLEIGRGSGGTDFAVITLQGTGTSHRATDLPVGISFARVRAKDAAATSAASSEVRFVVPDQRDVIEALFFETGPNRYVDLNGNSSTPNTDRFLRWPVGSLIQVRTAGLNDDQYGQLERVLLQVEEATHGSVRATIVERSSDPARFSPASRQANGELRVIVTPDMQAFCGNSTVTGCGGFGVSGGGVLGISASSVVIKSGTPGTDVIAHEVGHAVLALKHIQWGPWTNLNETSWPGLSRPLMFPSSTANAAMLSVTELDAIKAVYGSGLPSLGLRSEFYARGLIRNP